MASKAPRGSLVRFRDRDFTKEALMQHEQQIGPLAEGYEAQVEVRDLMMRNHIRMEQDYQTFLQLC